MNVLTYRAAYSFFPRETFDNRRAVPKQETKALDAIRKYADRGWEFISSTLPARLSPHKNSELQRRKRWVDDSYTWVLPFDTTGVKGRLGANENSLLTSLSCDPFTINGFDFINDIGGMKIEFDIFSIPSFHNSYTTNREFGWKLFKMCLSLAGMMRDLPTLTLLERCEFSIMAVRTLKVLDRNDRALIVLKDVCEKYCNCKTSDERA